ncbi:8-oxo-dGTP diphosphatase [Lysinibacter sp. HNR]|uniref:8-oxo-dGTP diphosphatase n=1 Tax=Lysinibacter sp. HNR TaxID=3031408 RepID=UPI0024353601|nr:8-oxo-dGTP diphosphatase [Lysinibacter sp. HNR]WGD36630.1 8-oxo-dGTP diphosphatase [Lysinibacter sp. HNR]
MANSQVSVCYLIRTAEDDTREVLLGVKKRGIGVGKLVGPGGKLEVGETPAQAIVREIAEETGLRVNPQDLREAGKIDYSFPSHPQWDQKSTVFVLHSWVGTPVNSDELELDWYPLDQIDYSAMWDDAQYWLPKVLRGGSVSAAFTFAEDLSTVATIDVR